MANLTSILNLGQTAEAVDIYKLDRTHIEKHGAPRAKGEGLEQDFIYHSAEDGSAPTLITVGIYPQSKTNEYVVKKVVKTQVKYYPQGGDLYEMRWATDEHKLIIPGLPYEWLAIAQQSDLRDLLMSGFSLWYGSVAAGVFAMDVIENMLYGSPSVAGKR